jgi:hypothetical protein
VQSAEAATSKRSGRSPEVTLEITVPAGTEILNSAFQILVRVSGLDVAGRTVTEAVGGEVLRRTIQEEERG